METVMLSEHSSHRSATIGVGLIEILMIMALVCILAAMSIPWLTELRQHRQLVSAADTLHAEIQHARSEAARLGANVQLSFSEHSLGTCYIIHIGKAGDCRCISEGRAICTAGHLLKADWIDKKSQLLIKANVPTMTFDPGGGYVHPAGTIGVTNAAGENISQVVSILGRIRRCTTTPDKNSLPRCDTKVRKS